MKNRRKTTKLLVPPVLYALSVLLLPVCGACSDSGGGSTERDAAGGQDVLVPRPDGAGGEDGGLVEGAYFVSPDGDDGNPGTIDQPWRTITRAANTLTAGETVYIRQSTYSERLVPQNSGTAGNPITFAGYPGEQATVDGAGVSIPGGWGGLVDLSDLSHIRITGLRVINAGTDDNHAGILVDNSSHISVENCYTYNTVSSGIGVWSSDNVLVHGNEVELACNDGEQECITIAITDQFEVSYNHVHHGGPGNNGGEGIDIKDGSSNGTVLGNVVHHMNRLGIYVDSWDKHTFNIDVFANRAYENQGSGFAVAAEAGGLLENVRIFNNEAFSNLYAGFTVGGWGEPVPSHPIANVLVINNTFWSNGTDGWGPAVVLENPDADDIVIRNNLMSQNASAQMEVDQVGQNLIVEFNLFHGDGSPYGTDVVTGDPMLTNPSGGDFHLQAGSPAINAGSSVDAPPDDFDGTARPQDTGYDIGAYEFVQ